MTRDDHLELSELAEQVGDRLLKVEAPLRACLAGPGSPDGAAALASLRNPYAIEDDPGAFHTSPGGCRAGSSMMPPTPWPVRCSRRHGTGVSSSRSTRPSRE